MEKNKIGKVKTEGLSEIEKGKLLRLRLYGSKEEKKKKLFGDE